jgi:hypothetical protein
MEFVFGVAGFGEVDNVAFVVPRAFGAVSGFEVIRRLQTGRSDLGIFLGARAAFHQVKVLSEDALHDLVSGFGGLGAF